MQLASHGAGLLARALPKVQASAVRTIHTHIPTSTSTGIRVLQTSRNFISRFVAHLVTPGILPRPSSSAVQAGARSIHVARPSARGGIQQRLSLPVRTALSRPLHAPFLPRPPAIPRSTTQVGLGCVRNFSSARPIFQNLVQNVPIAGRAFVEADWDLRIVEEKKKMVDKRNARKGKKQPTDTGSKIKPKAQRGVFDSVSTASPKREAEVELDHYFAPLDAPKVTTSLLIPLAPTPTSRIPLSQHGPSTSHPHPTLLPLSVLSSMHSDHTLHSHRVSSIFARLDQAQVWDRGVECAAYAQGTGEGYEGVCTVLRVQFVGWTKAEVRGIIGESGTGWCVLEEIWHDANDDLSDISEEEMSDRVSQEDHEETIDPAQSFVMPVLDFSSSFVAASSRPRASSPSPSWSFSSANSSTSDLLFSGSATPGGWDTDTHDVGSDWGSDGSEGSWVR